MVFVGYLVLIAALLSFLVLFAWRQWLHYYKHSAFDRYHEERMERIRSQHSERIYRDFEFFVKVFIALVGAVGYLRFSVYPGLQALPAPARLEMQRLVCEAMQFLGMLGLLTMMSLSAFVICHQASKIRRWRKVRWGELWFWQEVYIVLAMYLMASGLGWVVLMWSERSLG